MLNLMSQAPWRSYECMRGRRGERGKTTYVGHEVDPAQVLCHLDNGELLQIPKELFFFSKSGFFPLLPVRCWSSDADDDRATGPVDRGLEFFQEREEVLSVACGAPALGAGVFFGRGEA